MSETPSSKPFSEEQAAILLLKHHGFVYRQARRFVPVPDLAEDVVQQVFVEFLKNPDQWDIQSDLRPLLTVITRRTAQRIWRERAKMLPDSLRQIAEFIRSELSDSPEDREQKEERVHALWSCLSKMAEPARQLITHYYFDGISTEQLAEQMQKKTDTVSKSIYRLREKLRDCIERTVRREDEHV